jgi:ketosteroid isomerase-like protein
MRYIKLFYLFLICSFSYSYAQDKNETEIRRLEFSFKDALEKADSTALFKLAHPNYAVNNPTGKISTKPEISELFRTGKVNFSKFDQEIERIFFTENIAIVMGNEKVYPRENNGKVVYRRYTHTWLKTKKGWQLLARQSAVFENK